MNPSRFTDMASLQLPSSLILVLQRARGISVSVSGLPSRLPLGKQTYSSQTRFDTYHVLIRLILMNTVFRLLFFTNSKINYHDRFKPSLIFASLEEFSDSTFYGGRSEDSYHVAIFFRYYYQILYRQKAQHVSFPLFVSFFLYSLQLRRSDQKKYYS